MKSVLVVHAAVPAEKRGRARLSVRSVVGRRTRTSESEPVCASDSADGVHFIRSRREGRKEAKRRHHPHPDIANSSVCEKIVLSEAAFPCLRSASGIITNSEGDALASGGCSPPSRLSLPLATHKIRAWGTQCARETECLQCNCRLDTGQCQSDRWRRDDGQCSALSQNATTCELKIRSRPI